MAFKCIAARPCDSHGVISWEHPPPLISLMDYNNRKSAWPATNTTPHLLITAHSLTRSTYRPRNIHANAETHTCSPVLHHSSLPHYSYVTLTAAIYQSSQLSLSLIPLKVCCVGQKNQWHGAHCCWRWWRARRAAAWH